MKYLYFLLGLFLSNACIAQNATIQGVILNDENKPIANAAVTVTGTTIGTASNENGFYKIIVPANQKLTISITSLNYKAVIIKDLELLKNEFLELNPVMAQEIETITTVLLSNTSQRSFEGITTVEPVLLRRIPGAQAGVENIIKSLPGTITNNELSTQYGVRGGNYDENLVYINEIEVYRPFLIRSGQQEGLSFVNSDLVQNIEFSAGGFQSKYGDKLSSVLDIDYRRPTTLAAGVDASLLGVNGYVEGTAFAKAATGILGLRYRDNSLLINSQEANVNTAPRFIDAQTYLTYRLNPKLDISFLGNISVNSYEYQPLNRQTNFGTIQEPIAVVINYDGREDDQYETYFGAVKLSYDVNKSLNLRFITSIYNTQEQEHYDILARYGIGRPNTNIGSSDLGEVDFVNAIGSELEHGRNNLDALIVNGEHRGTYKIKSEKKNPDQIDWGMKYSYEDIRDRLREYTALENNGFNVRPPFDEFRNDQPYNPFVGPLAPFTTASADNNIQITRGQFFAQYSSRSFIKNHELFWNIGTRAHVWNVAGTGVNSVTQTVISPRGQIALKPYWQNTDMLFRLSGGLYYQPPFYRELRDLQGMVNPNVKAQQSYHIVLANDYSFTNNNKPFKLTSEIYYKGLNDVNTYTLENVRIRYRANNEAIAYAYGVDFRLNGEFVPGTDSWISVGYLETKENQNDRGYISRPTDQRLKFALLYQDYIPNIPNVKLYMNLLYSTGLPGGSPDFSDPYDFQFRLKNYGRADIGVNLVLKDDKKSSNLFKDFNEVSIGAEIYNLFDNQNSITNIWVRDVSSERQIAIPNFLTPRVFNIRIIARW